jgi:hypothetical protein
LVSGEKTKPSHSRFCNEHGMTSLHGNVIVSTDLFRSGLSRRIRTRLAALAQVRVALALVGVASAVQSDTRAPTITATKKVGTPFSPRASYRAKALVLDTAAGLLGTGFVVYAR